MENYVTCKLTALEDGKPTTRTRTLICTEKEFELLQTHLDKKSYRLEEARWVKDSVSLNVKDFVVENTGLETGTV